MHHKSTPEPNFKAILQRTRHSARLSCTPLQTNTGIHNTILKQVPEVGSKLKLSKSKPPKQKVDVVDMPATSRKPTASKSTEACDDIMSLPLFNARLGGPTKESNPRIELCARANVGNGKTSRVFVCNFSLSKWGPTFTATAQSIRDAINAGALTKAQALELRNRMMPQT